MCWSIKSRLHQKRTGSYPRQKNIPKVYDVKSPIKWVGFAVGSKVHEDGRTPWDRYIFMKIFQDYLTQLLFLVRWAMFWEEQEDGGITVDFWIVKVHTSC